MFGKFWLGPDIVEYIDRNALLPPYLILVASLHQIHSFYARNNDTFLTNIRTKKNFRWNEGRN